MKKLFYLIVVIIVCVVACTSEEMVPTERVRTHGESRLIVKNNHVSLDNVMTLTGAMRKATRAAVGEEDDDFICIVDTDNDTLFYVVNLPEGGWTMYASDKRVPAIAAECPKGRFVLNEAMEVYGAWLEDMKEDMKRVQNAEDKDLNFTAEEIEANKAYWDAVCNADEFARSHIETTRGGILDPGLLIPPGHYELDTTYTYLTSYDSLDHLTNTIWHQHYPYNYYCPQKTVIDNPDDPNSPAGCVAIAGAQMIYYLHYKLGTPEYIPDSAYCTGNVNNYSWGQYTYNRNVWQKTPNYGNMGFYTWDFNGNWVEEGRMYAPLIANIGFLVNMDYGNDGSNAETGDLVNVFSHYGISCQYVDYDKDILHNSLSNGMPVIARAKYNVLKGHAFIIDGYKRKAMQTTYIYKWVSDILPLPHNPGGPFTPGLDPGIIPADSIVHTYSMISLSYIKMNWGWGPYAIDNNTGHYANDIWFTPTGDWIIDSNNFDRKRKMIYNFATINM